MLIDVPLGRRGRPIGLDARTPHGAGQPTGRTPAERVQVLDESNWNEGGSGPACARTTVGGLDRAGVQPIAERGVVGRAVLLHMARFRGQPTLDKGETSTHGDLLACADARGVETTRRALDELSDALAAGLLAHGLAVLPSGAQHSPLPVVGRRPRLTTGLASGF